MKTKILLISALTIEIDMKDSFGVGESISYDYKLISDEDITVKYLPYAECPNAPQPFMSEKEVSLKANEEYADSFSYSIVDESTEPQTCTAYIEVQEPFQIEQKTFQIVTDPSFSFNIKLNKKTFVKGEDINIDYESDKENPSITATLTYPGGKKETIILPTSIKASQIGTYKIEVSASKSGYKTASLSEQFGVIEEHAEIKEAELPSASVAPEIKRGGRKVIGKILLYIFIVVIMLALIFGIWWLIRKYKRGVSNVLPPQPQTNIYSNTQG